MKNNDALFAEKPVSPRYVRGIYPAARSETDIFVKHDDSDRAGIVLPLRHGSVYTVKFSQKPRCLRTALCDADPEQLPVPGGMAAALYTDIPYFDGAPDTDAPDFLCVPKKAGQYLVIWTGEDEDFPISIGENPVLLGHDTDDCWFTAPDSGDLNGGEGSWGDWRWSFEDLCRQVYEPLRARYPDYISRQWIGRDESGQYDMWAYIFEPADYEQVLFVTGGLHGAEIDGYLGLARFLQLMCEQDGSHEGLRYLREKVKLVVVPLVNVWSAANTHIRQNSTGMDLNRDFAIHSQAETVNVIWLLHQYKDQAAALLDFHTARSTAQGLYYQFSIQAPNSAVCRKVVNHIWEGLKARGWESDPADLSLIPGKYEKGSCYLQGYAWNRFGIPTLVVEHNNDRWYPLHSAQALQHCVECYGNQLIQTALAKLKLVR